MRHEPHKIGGHICPAGEKPPQVPEKPRYDTDKNVLPPGTLFSRALAVVVVSERCQSRLDRCPLLGVKRSSDFVRV
jgi:hypothetical protein